MSDPTLEDMWRERLKAQDVDPTREDVDALIVTVRAAGRDLGDMGPPAEGRFYLVLEVPDGEHDVITQAFASGRIRLEPAPRPAQTGFAWAP